MKLILVVFCLIAGSATQSLLASRGGWSVREYGAVGDNETLDTIAIQKAIDSCSAAGGGRVSFDRGVFRSGTLYLRDNVTLELEAGAVLRASDNLEDFPSIPSKHSAYQQEMVTNKMFLYAEDVENIAIIGQGIIDGNGDHWVEGPYGFPSFSKRPRIIHFRGCENILIRDITLYNSASWVQSYQSCKDLVIEDITVNSRENKDIEKERYADVPGRNTDGLDLVDCERVRISNCFINSGDDAICLKSLAPDEACRDITITNCVISSNASGIKIGTESSGRFEDIVINNCVVYDTRRDAVSIMTVDGARMERIQISDISVRNIKTSAIFIRLGKRFRTYREGAKINTPHLKDVIIENITGTRISSGYGCIVSGIRDIPVEHILLRNIDLEFEGGGTVEQANRQLPEEETAYPNGLIFGELPAYGFYIRHAKDITLDNVNLRTIRNDDRPALVVDNVQGLYLSRLRASMTKKAAALVRLNDSGRASIFDNVIHDPIPKVFQIEGSQTRDIILFDNHFPQAGQLIKLGDEVPENQVTFKP